MKQQLLKKLSLCIIGLGLSFSGFSQMLCNASYTYTDNGNGNYTFTNTSTGVNPATTQTSWLVNWAYVGTGNTFNYSFPGNGNYGICIEMNDSINSCGDSLCNVITVTGMAGGTGCHAGFTSFVNGYQAGFGIQTNLPNFNPNAVTHISWNFGDGTSTGPTPAFYPNSFNGPYHNYNAPGTYAVCLTLIDSFNLCSDTYCDSVTILPNNATGCHAYFNANATSNNNEMQYTVGYSNPLFDSSYVSHIHWDFGDGTSSDGVMFGPGPNIANVVKSYASSGNYAVCLTLTDSIHNCTDVYCDSVYVGPVAPTCNANFALWQDSTNTGTWYAYNYSTATSGSLSLLWDFGDGSTSTQLYPTHTYASAGHYIICLTITDTLISCTSTYCDSSSNHKVSSTASMMSFTVLPSGTNSIKNNDVFSSVGVYPNPVGDNTTLNITAAENTNVTYSIYDMYGQVIASQKTMISKGKNTINLNTTDLSNGVYFINIMDNINKKMSTIKIVK